MRYRFFTSPGTLRERIIASARIDEALLDISSYQDIHIEEVEAFRTTLLSLKDRRFLIVGDYDCDGISSTTIMKRLFDHLGIASNYTIPSRHKEGYGLHTDTVKMAKEHGFEAILTVDNGVAAKEEIALAKDLGLKVLVIDHHEYEERPDVDAFLHPSILHYGYDKLCAGGLCTLLADTFYEDDLIDVLGGLATQADMVGVLGYNRFLLKRMKRILETKEIWPIRFLSDKGRLDYDELSFSVIPKINALSRLGYNVNILVKYLLSDRNTCRETAKQIDKINRERQSKTREMAERAKGKVREEDELLLISDESFEEGLCGLLANRLLQSYQKPVIILKADESEYKGSGRSVSGFNLYEYLKGFPSFKTFGGHDRAVGLSLEKGDYEAFINYIDTHVPLYEQVFTDAVVIDENEMDMENFLEYESLKPFGMDFPEPVFALRDPSILRTYYVKDLYPKFRLGNGMDAISFEKTEIPDVYDSFIGKLQRDRYRPGQLLFLIEDFQ